MKLETAGVKPCIFCGVAAGTTSAAIVYRDEHLLAFLDHRPLFPGHVLLIPKAHYETLADLPAKLDAAFLAAGKALAAAIEGGMKAEGSFLAINNRVSQSVPHLHMHIVPRSRGDGLKGFFWPRHPYRDDAHMEEVRAAIAAQLSGGSDEVSS